MNFIVPQTVMTVALAIKQAGGRALIVGGWVRDQVMDRMSDDIDVEVYNLKLGILEGILKAHGNAKAAGNRFGVIILSTEEGKFDFSLPRLDNKTGTGYKGFSVDLIADLSIEAAAFRRDFTMNAMAYDPLTNELFDPYNGKEHIRMGIIVPTSNKFSEDPSRVLRGMQFAARLNMIPSRELITVSQDMVHRFDEIGIELTWKLWHKLIVMGVTPSNGLWFLLNSWWHVHFPELKALVGIPQHHEYHPEGDVWHHTMYVVDAAAEIIRRPENDDLSDDERITVMLGALCHDLGKPETTVYDSHYSSPGHAEAGVKPTLSFLERIGCPKKLHEPICALVREHMVHVSLRGGETPSARTVNRLINRMDGVPLRLLGIVIEADHSGRPPLPKGMPRGFQAILDAAQDMPSETQPIVLGRDLIALGMKPGKEMGVVLSALLELQLDGKFTTLEEGKRIAKEMINLHRP